MAKKSAAHKKLIKEAKKLGITSPHLFGEDNLKAKIAEAKKTAGDQNDTPNHEDGSAGQGEKTTPAAGSETKDKETPKGKVSENKDGLKVCPKCNAEYASTLDSCPECVASGGNENPGKTQKKSPPDLSKEKKVILKKVEGYLYHETDQPRVFKSGEEVPDGWTIENRKFWEIGEGGVLVHVEG